LLLLLDLVKRASDLSVWYTNAGLLPNHRLLWRPDTPHQLSYLYALFTAPQVQVAFAITALIYLCFLVGFRTRLMHVLSWFALLSMQTRATILTNGGDYVFCTLLLWSMFLPLGARFSIDRWLAQTRAPAAPTPQPITSLAALALLLQLAVIYLFNGVHKTGVTWREGSAVYYMLHQARIVTVFGLWMREHAPLPLLQGLSYATLVIEHALPLLISSPMFLWPRRLAIVFIWGFHGSIALLANLGLFSPVMMVFSLILLGPADWEWLEQHFGQHVDRLRAKLGRVLAWLAGRSATPASAPPSAAACRLRELTVAVLMVIALSQITVENRSVPALLRPPQPDFMAAAVSYLRLNQGWGMFAPDAPRNDLSIVVDALTVDGRHIDPYNARASVVADPSLRKLPARLGQNWLYCDYTVRIGGSGVLHDPLREWILAHHIRTQRPEDRILSFNAYLIEQISPEPRELNPTKQHARKFLSGKATE
jgi:hypothetical protein